jgi:hypothetical protein
MEDDNLVGDLSLTFGILSTDDFSLGETTLSSCCSIFEAISLDFDGKGGKLLLGMVSSSFSADNLLWL